MIRITTTPSGPQLFVFNRRTHHGLIGCVLAVVGVGLAIHDRGDIADWLCR